MTYLVIFSDKREFSLVSFSGGICLANFPILDNKSPFFDSVIDDRDRPRA